MTTFSQARNTLSAAPTVQSQFGLITDLRMSQQIALTCAVMCTSASIGIAIYAGWQTGGLWFERVLRVIIAAVAVLYVHWIPIRWKFFGLQVRIATALLWAIAIVVVVYGQVTFVMTSQKHAGDIRAVTLEIPSADPPNSDGRSRTEIANDLAKVTTELARSEVRRCLGDCPGLKVLKVRLTEQIAALKTEDDEARRRAMKEDRDNLKADRLADLRTTARRDPVASVVSSWFGTSEYFIELIVGLGHAIALEGIAMIAWMIVAVMPGREKSHGASPDISREPVVSDDSTESLADDAIVKIGRGTHDDQDEHRLLKVKTAIAKGEIAQSQEAIRVLIGCGQVKAKWLNHEYSRRFGSISA